MQGKDPTSGQSPRTPAPQRPGGAPLTRPVTSPFARAIDWVRRKLPPQEYLIVILLVAVFTDVMGTIEGLRNAAFLTPGSDIGFYNQAFYTTAFDHRFFYETLNIPNGTNGYLFAQHFTPFLFVLVPFYALAPGPMALLLLETAAVGAGAIPTFAIARYRLGADKWGFLFAGVYLLLPLTQATGWSDFDPEPFFIAPALAAFYFYMRGRWWPFLAFWLVALSIIETTAPFLVLFAVAAFLGTLAVPAELDWLSEFRGRSPSVLAPARERMWMFISAVIAVVWIGVALAVEYSLAPQGGTFGSAYAENYQVLGATTFFNVIPTAITNPAAATAALGFDGGVKVLYVLLVLGSFGFLPILGGKRFLLPVVFWMALALLSNRSSFYSLGSQYTGLVLPFLVAGAIGGAVRVQSYLAERESRPAPVPYPRPTAVRSRWAFPATATVLVLVVLATNVTASPTLAAPSGFWQGIVPGVPSITAHDQFIGSVLNLIPHHASVLATPHLYTQLGNRVDAHCVLLRGLFFGNFTYFGVLNASVNASNYVVMDFGLDKYAAIVLTNFANLTPFGLEASADGVLLYARGWTGSPAEWVPFSTIIAGGDLEPGAAQVTTQPSTPYGPTLYHPPTRTKGATIWAGPNLGVYSPGQYRVTFTLQVTPQGNGTFLAVGIGSVAWRVQVNPYLQTSMGRHYNLTFGTGGRANLGNASLTGSSVGRGVQWANVSELVTWTSPGLMYLWGTTGATPAAVIVYWISLVEIAPPT